MTSKTTETTPSTTQTDSLPPRYHRELVAAQQARTPALERAAPEFAKTVTATEKVQSQMAQNLLGRKAPRQPDLTAPIHIEPEDIQAEAEKSEVSTEAAREYLCAKTRRRRVQKHIDNTAKEIGLARFGAFCADLLALEEEIAGT